MKPSIYHPFEVNENTKNLMEDYTQVLHSMVAKLLFLSNQSHPDIITSISFLTTCMHKQDKEEDKKLAHVLKYLKATEGLVLNLESYGSGNMKLWVDAGFDIHHSMLSHTGGMLSLGKGAIYLASTKQKLDTKIST